MKQEILNLLSQMPKPTTNAGSGYKNEDTYVPRVTKIIQRCIHNDGLMYWANGLGFKHQSYSEVLNNAAKIGTQCHDNIDKFLDDNAHTPNNIMLEAKNAYDSFHKWYNDVLSCADISVVMHEQTIVCDYFGGTLDGLYKINDKLYLIDYKTSNHVTYNYCLQLAAYMYMLKEVMDIDIDGCIVLQLSKTEVGYNEFALDFSNENDKQFMDNCLEAFLVMVLWYYYLNLVESQYKALDWGG